MTKYAERHILVTIGGASPAERWQFGTRWRWQGAEPTTASLGAMLGRIVNDALPGCFLEGGSGISVGYTVDLVKVASIGTNGKYPDGVDAAVQDGTAIITGSRNAGVPAPQLATVATFETGTKRGLAHYGRIYLPVLEWTVQAADGRITAARAADIAVGCAAMLRDIRTALDDGTSELCVFSALKDDDVRAPAVRAVTFVSVGRVVDTHRSRRESLDEDRQSTPLDA